MLQGGRKTVRLVKKYEEITRLLKWFVLFFYPKKKKNISVAISPPSVNTYRSLSSIQCCALLQVFSPLTGLAECIERH